MMYMYCCTTMKTLQEQFDFFFTYEIAKGNDCYSAEDRSYIAQRWTMKNHRHLL